MQHISLYINFIFAGLIIGLLWSQRKKKDHYKRVPLDKKLTSKRR